MHTAPNAPRPPGLYLQLGIAFGAFIFIGMSDGVGGVLLPSYQQQYGLDKSGVSLLFFAGTLGFLLAAFASGPMREKLGVRAFLALGAACALGGMTTIATAPPWQAVLASIGLLGFGIGTLDAGLNSYVAELPDNSARLNYLHAFYGAGALLGPLLAAGILAALWPWNGVYAVLAGGAALLVLALAAIFRPAAAPHEQATSARNVLAASLSLPLVWLGAVFMGAYVGLEVSIGSWTYSFLTEERGEGTLLAGWLVSGYWLGLTLGRLVLGRATRRFGNLLVIQVCLAGTSAGLLLFWLVPGTLPAGLGLALAGFSLGPMYPTMIAVAATVVPARLLPSAIGFMSSLGAGGGAFFPWLAGNLANRFGLAVILPYAIALTAVVLVCWLLFQWRLRAPAHAPEEPQALVTRE